MANAHGLLSRSHWQGVSLKELVGNELAPCVRTGGASVLGPDILVSAEAAQPIAIVLHELVTNASKYGALSAQRGHITVRWRCQPNDQAEVLLIEWIETGGPAVMAPTQTGYGTRCIPQPYSYELGGAVDLVFDPAGVRCTIEVPRKRHDSSEALELFKISDPIHPQTQSIGGIARGDSFYTDQSRQVTQLGFELTSKSNEALMPDLLEQKPWQNQAEAGKAIERTGNRPQIGDGLLDKPQRQQLYASRHDQQSVPRARASPKTRQVGWQHHPCGTDRSLSRAGTSDPVDGRHMSGVFARLSLVAQHGSCHQFGREAIEAKRLEYSPSMRGKTCVITGATSGIGRAAAEGLAAMGARIVMLARNKQRGEAMLTKLRDRFPLAEHSIYYADLLRLAEVKRAAADIAAAEPRVDVLLNNAGAMFAWRKITPDGFERTFALNHVAPFVLTHGLRERLFAAAPARVVNTAGALHHLAMLHLEDLRLEHKYSAFYAYAHAKLMLRAVHARARAGAGPASRSLPIPSIPEKWRRTSATEPEG